MKAQQHDERLIAQFPNLKPYPHTPAENLRRELREAFPDMKFSIRYKSFSGGDAIHIRYTDGMSQDKVERIARKYAYDGSNCDLMTDYFEYDRTPFNEIFGGAKFVSVCREMSEATRARLTAEVSERFPELVGKSIERNDFLRGLEGDRCTIELLEITRGLFWVDIPGLVREMFRMLDLPGPAVK